MLFVVFLIVSYRSALGRPDLLALLGPLGITLWSVLLIYNLTESAFAWDLMWVIFLLGNLAVPLQTSEFGHTSDEDVVYAGCGETPEGNRLRLPLHSVALPTSYDEFR